jgi:hypothetical protein
MAAVHHTLAHIADANKALRNVFTLHSLRTGETYRTVFGACSPGARTTFEQTRSVFRVGAKLANIVVARQKSPDNCRFSAHRMNSRFITGFLEKPP